MGFLSENQTAVRYLSLAAAGIVTVCQAVVSFRRKGFWKKQGLALMSAGAWSNTFDRLARGYVIDYVGFDVKDPKSCKDHIQSGRLLHSGGSCDPVAVLTVFSFKKGERESQKKRRT